MTHTRITWFGAACAGFFVLSVIATPLYAQMSPLLEDGREVRKLNPGVRLLVDKQWNVTESTKKITLRGPEYTSFALYPKSDRGSRLGSSVIFEVSTMEGIFDVPQRLRGKLSESDLVNWYIDLLSRSLNDFHVHSVRRETILGESAYVFDYSEISYDHYEEYTGVRFVFKGDKVYKISSSYLPGRKEIKPLIEAMVAQIRLLSEEEKRYLTE